VSTLSHKARTIPRNVLLLLGAMGLTSLLGLLALSWWMTRTIDQISQESTGLLVDKSLASHEVLVSELTYDYAYWELAYDRVARRDGFWVFDNMGNVVETAAIERLLVTDYQGAPLFGFREGTDGGDMTAFDGVDLAPFFEKLKRSAPTDYSFVTGYGLIDGTPAIISAMRIVPYDLDGSEPDTFSRLVMISILDEAMLHNIVVQLDLKGLRVADPAMADPARTVALYAPDGTAVAHLDWQYAAPGPELFSRSLLFLAAISTLILLCAVVIGRVTAHQTKAFLTEHLRAREDALTGLANRTGWNEMVTSEDVAKRIAAGHVACLYLDVDEFKALNDTHGHDIGDLALRKLADRLRAAARPQDFLARLGGDEFVVMIVDEEPEVVAQMVSARLQRHLSTQFRLTEHIARRMEVSIGIVVSEEGSDWRHMLACADAEMYRAKRSRKAMRAGQRRPDNPVAHLVRKAG